jgi:anti-anti-sigma factor
VEVAGEIDMATSPRLRRRLLDAIATGRPGTAVQVDLAGVYFIDSGGIAALAGVQRAASGTGVSLSVRNPRGVVLRLFHILGLTDLLRVDEAPTSST